MRRLAVVFAVVVLFAGSAAGPGAASRHPSVLFTSADVALIRARAAHPTLAPVTARLLSRAETLLKAAPIQVSTTGRGEPDPPGYIKGLDAARRLQGRVLTYAMAFLLNGDTRYRAAAVAELDRAISQWPIWVDTAHPPPYDLMAGEISLTFRLRATGRTVTATRSWLPMRFAGRATARAPPISIAPARVRQATSRSYSIPAGRCRPASATARAGRPTRSSTTWPARTGTRTSRGSRIA